jgi:hypothetical protein
LYELNEQLRLREHVVKGLLQAETRGRKKIGQETAQRGAGRQQHQYGDVAQQQQQQLLWMAVVEEETVVVGVMGKGEQKVALVLVQ